MQIRFLRSPRLRLLLLILLMMMGAAGAAMTRKEALAELGLSRQSSSSPTPKEIKAAYRKRSLETHPDKGGSKESFVKVAEAYETLTSNNNAGAQAGGNSQQQYNAEDMADAMKRAEDMFFDVFDDLFDADTVSDAVDEIFDKLAANFGSEAKKTKTATSSSQQVQTMGWGLKILKAAVKWAAPKVMSMLESEGTTININGNTMSGSEFKEWRERKRRERKTAKENINAPPPDL